MVDSPERELSDFRMNSHTLCFEQRSEYGKEEEQTLYPSSSGEWRG